MNWDNLTLQTIFMGGAFVSSALSFVSAAFVWRMRATFATRLDMKEFEEKLETRLASIDRSISQKPDDNEMTALYLRVGRLEVSEATAAEGIRGVHMMMQRVEHQVSLLVQYRMMESRP